MPMTQFLRKFLAEDDGPTAVEYAVMIALIVGVCVASVSVLATGTAASYDRSAAQLSSVLGS